MEQQKTLILKSEEDKPIVHEWYRRHNIKLRSAEFGNAVYDPETQTCVIFSGSYVYLKDLAKRDEFHVLQVNQGEKPGERVQRKIEEIANNRIVVSE